MAWKRIELQLHGDIESTAFGCRSIHLRSTDRLLDNQEAATIGDVSYRLPINQRDSDAFDRNKLPTTNFVPTIKSHDIGRKGCLYLIRNGPWPVGIWSRRRITDAFFHYATKVSAIEDLSATSSCISHCTREEDERLVLTAGDRLSPWKETKRQWFRRCRGRDSYATRRQSISGKKFDQYYEDV